MNSRSSRQIRSVSPAVARPVLAWVHDGMRHHVTIENDRIVFAAETAPGLWAAVAPADDVFASTVLAISGAQWQRFLEFLPAAERAFVRRFEFGRMAALHVVTRCPALLPELAEVPALMPFLAAHLALRGGAQPAWSEIGVVFEREGIFGVLQWLGLPASRQTLAILRNVADPDLPRRLLEPLRAALWDPETLWTLAHTSALTDEQIAVMCHALAA